MTTLIFGKDGQVGKALQSLWGNQSGVIFLGRSDCDVADPDAVHRVLNQHQPDVIVNAAAYTAVDRAQSEPELAFAINAKAPQMMAEYLAQQPAGVLVHFSTDYVFGDSKPAPHPYVETDVTGPVHRLGVYGQSKLAGEEAILRTLRNSPIQHYILRTSWVYGDGGNFIKTILRLAKEKNLLKVIGDQFGVPTSATWLAQLVLLFVNHSPDSGIYHAVPNGITNWYQLASLAIQEAKDQGEFIRVEDDKILEIPAIQFPLPAPRPYNSCLSNQKLQNFLGQLPAPQLIPQWDQAVRSYVQALVSSKS